MNFLADRMGASEVDGRVRMLVMLCAMMAAFAGGLRDACAQEFVIVSDGEPTAVFVVPEKLSHSERLALQELSDHIEQMAGAAPARVATGEKLAEALKGRRPIYVGRAVSDDVRAKAFDDSASDDAFALRVSEQAVELFGAGDSGTLYAAYELLEQLGVRWFMPGEIGLVVPKSQTVAISAMTITQQPSFELRGVSTTDRTWSRRMRLGGTGPGSTLNMPSVGSFDEFPQRYALVDGQRNKGQLCLTNQETFDAFVQLSRDFFEKHPDMKWMPAGNHGGGHCECDDCRALDTAAAGGPFTGGINVTDRYIWFMNRVLDALHEDFPDRRICLTIATPHILPPAKLIGHRNLDIQAWVNAYCRIHGVNNPVCPERMMVLEQTRVWVSKLEGTYSERTNWGNIAGPGLLFPAVHRFREDFPAYFDAGVVGVRGHAYSHWISENPSAYIGAKLLWNHEADVDALLADFYQKYYGPAAAQMKQYHELVEQAARDADHHTGTAINSPQIFHDEVRKKAAAHLAAAMKQTGDDVYRERVEAVVLALAYTDAFARMIEHRNRHAYAEAIKAMGEAEAARDRLLTEYTPPLLAANFARSYFDLFFGNVIREAADHVTPPKKMVAGLDDVWQFKLDPSDEGVRAGWQNPRAKMDGHREIKAYSQSWSDQGLRNQEGVAWYWQSISLPSETSGRLMLWFAGVDEHATVWINGKLVGESHRNVFKSFKFDVTDIAQLGEVNLVAVRVENKTLDEVGTGGLLGPVMFYSAPAERAQAD